MNEKIKKMKQFFIKNDELLFKLISILIIIGINIFVKTEPTDEMWNFQNIYKMYNGYKIYIDANVITTPLFQVIGNIIFHLIGANFLVFKLYGIVINISLYFGVFRIFKSLELSKNNVILISLVSVLASINVYHNTANYNNLCLVFAVYGISFIINKNKYSNTKFIIIESCIAFLILITKQNIGILFLVSIFLYNLIFEKENRIKNIFKISFINFILIDIFIIILANIGILDGFISYAILGLKEFATKNPAIEVESIKLIFIALVTMASIIFINHKKILKSGEIKNINIIACFSFPFLFISYPIINIAHIDASLFLTYILLIYIIYLVLIKKLTKEENIKKINIYIITILVIIAISQIILYFNKIDYDYKYNNVYFGSIMEKSIKDKIITITDYIEKSEKRVIIISADAALYMIPLNKNNGNLDEPLIGNFGKEGEDGVIEEIKKIKNVKILINKQKKVYQESDKIIQYVKNNLVYAGEIEDLLIYETK